MPRLPGKRMPIENIAKEHLEYEFKHIQHRSIKNRKSRIIGWIIGYLITNKYKNVLSWSNIQMKEYESDLKELCKEGNIHFSTIKQKSCLFPWDKNFSINDIDDIRYCKLNVTEVYHKYTKNPKHRKAIGTAKIVEIIENKKSDEIKKETFVDIPYSIYCLDCYHEWNSKQEFDNICPKCHSKHTIYNDFDELPCLR